MKPLLYSLVPQDTLQAMAETFYTCIHLSIQIINENGETLVSQGEVHEFCHLFQSHLSSENACEHTHLSASKKAISLGEPYIFECHAQLNHIVFPLITKETFLGSILVGPFLMDQPDSVLISDIAKKYKISTDDALNLYDEVRSIPVVPPATVNHISHLLFYMFSNLIADSKQDLLKNNQKLLQQSRINESIQRYKAETIHNTTYPYEKEKALIQKVKTGNVPEANAILNDLLGYVLFSKGNSLDVVKTRSVELCSLLSRTAMEGGASPDAMLNLNSHFIKNLQQIDTLDSLCHTPAGDCGNLF